MGTIKSFKKFIDESLWSEIQDRSAGDTVRQEEFTEEFIDKVESSLIDFTMLVVYYIKNYELTLDGFYKYLEENENPDEVKKIIYYVKTHKDECDKLLEKDIKFENKLLDEKVNGYLLRFVDDIVYGDVNVDGSVTIADAVLLNKYLVNSAVLTGMQLKNADAYKNGSVNSADTLAILKFIVGTYDKLPFIE